MRTLTKLGIGMLAVILLLSCAWMYHTHSLYETTYRSEYRYEVTVITDLVLHNVTLYVPLPVSEDGSKISCEIVAKNASKPEGGLRDRRNRAREDAEDTCKGDDS